MVMVFLGIPVFWVLLSQPHDAPAPVSICDRADALVQELPARIQTCRTDSCVEWYIKQSQKWDAECHDAGTVEQ